MLKPFILAALIAGAATTATAQPAFEIAAPVVPTPDLSTTTVEQGDFPSGEFRHAPPVSPSGQGIVQGEPNFVKMSSFPENHPLRQLSAKVGQLIVVTEERKAIPFCSGAMVGPQLFLTNHHCVDLRDKGIRLSPNQLVVTLGHYEQGRLGRKDQVSAVAMVLKQDFLLDYALLLLSEPLGERTGWLMLETDPAVVDAVGEVKIIQHPSGRSKEVVLEDTKVVANKFPFLHYMADTEGGSSGSPVFALDGERLIALHHVGTRSYNEGVRAPRIAAEMAFYLQVSQPNAQSAAPSTVSAAPAPARTEAAEPRQSGSTNLSDALR